MLHAPCGRAVGACGEIVCRELECVQEAEADLVRLVRTIVGTHQASFCSSNDSYQLKVKAGGRGRVPSSGDLPPA